MSKKEKFNFLLKRGVAEIIEKESLKKKLKRSGQLRVKLGLDATAPFLHLGNAAALRKLRQFQELGHQAVLIIGDFTAMIGDPAGRAEARKSLNAEEVKANMKHYLKQAGKILDLKKTETRRNSEWFLKEGANSILELARLGSVQQVLRREDFQKRLKQGRDITLLETLYPLFQGYDSVKVKADIEIGATEQKFNLLMGRRIQRHFGMPEQDIMTFEILIGTDGVKKMSKTAGNFIKIDEAPETQFAQIMNLKDELMPMYFELLTDVPEKEINRLKTLLKRPTGELKEIKSRLAFEIVKLIHGRQKAEAGRRNFRLVFKEKQAPALMPEFKIKKNINLKELLIKSGFVSSGSEAQRLIEQKAVSLDNNILRDWRQKIILKEPAVLKIGKHRFLKLLP